MKPIRRGLCLALSAVLAALCALSPALAAGSLTAGQTVEGHNEFSDYYTFTLTGTSTVTLELWAQEESTAFTASLGLTGTSGQAYLPDMDGVTAHSASAQPSPSAGIVSRRSVVYKLNPDTYTLHFKGGPRSDSPGTAYLTLRSIQAMSQDSLNEPNNGPATAKLIQLNETIHGNILYSGGTLTDTGAWPQSTSSDCYDYYRIVTSQPNTRIRLTAQRTDAKRERGITLYAQTTLPDGEIHRYPELLDLSDQASGWVDINVEQAGVSFIVVRGGSLPTEYSFTLTRPDSADPNPTPANGTWRRQDDGTWKFIDINGKPMVGWQFIQDVWYYFSNLGVMQTGWLRIGSAWYYLRPSGAMATGWAYASGGWYYLNSSGMMRTGWLQIGQDWYYLSALGAMRTGWLYYGTHWYFLDDTGAMVTGERRIDGTAHQFNEDGQWLEGN